MTFYEKVKLLNQRKNLEIQLRNEIDAMMQEESTIIGKGFASNATQAEYKQAQTAHKMLIEQMKLQLQRVDKSIVEQAVNESLLENNGEINETVLEKIATKIEQKSKAKGKDIQIDREALGKNIDGVLAGNLTQQALNKTKGKKSNDNLAQEIKKAKEKLKKDLAKQAQTTKMSKNEKRENLERGIKQELEAYIKEQQNKNEILKELKVNDLANLITEAMNTEGSFLRQLDGDGTKSTSNEDTKIGGQSDLPEQDGLGVHSNVDMKKTKESTKSEGGSKTSSTVELKNVDVNKVYEEISPILETVAEIRKVEEKLNRESVKVKKAKVEDIVNKIGENISRNNSGSVERARQKARERSNAGASKEQLPGRKSKRSTSNVKDKDKEKIGKNNAPQIKLKN